MSIGAYNPSNSRVYYGLSTDTKPTAAIGDRFLEMDSNKVYIYYNSTWNQCATISATGAVAVTI